MSEIRAPKMCGLFEPGHNPHWIQISRATEDTVSPSTPWRLIQTEKVGTVVIQRRDLELRLWNHEVERLAEAAGEIGGVVEYQPRWRLLWVPSTIGRHAFCVTSSLGDHVPCPRNPPVGSPVELLLNAGGFGVSVIVPSPGV